MNLEDMSEEPSTELAHISQGVKAVGKTSTSGTVYYEFSDSDSGNNRLLVISIDGDLIWAETIGELTSTETAVERLQEDFDLVEVTSFGNEIGLVQEEQSETTNSEPVEKISQTFDQESIDSEPTLGSHNTESSLED